MLLDAIDAALAGRRAPAPAPWQVWLVVALIRRRARQRWRHLIVRTHLADASDDDSRSIVDRCDCGTERLCRRRDRV